MPEGTQKVLLVDDDPAMLRLLAKWLEAAGYETQRASDGRQAIAAIESECPHIIITDWEMPNLDGLELCRWLRTQTLPHYVYTIFVTVRNGLADIIKGLDAGADDFLKKPIDRGELLARLKAGERLVELERRLSAMAFCDSLTGLATQRTYYEHLNREWHRAQRFSIPLTCVMLDVDFFKRVNDTYGHPTGDGVIRRVADILRQNTRASDIVSRYGGEEFCIALPETNEQQALLWAERVRKSMAQALFPVVNQNKEIRVTISMGLVTRHDQVKSPEMLVEFADQALLVAKRSGRDRVVSYHALAQADLNSNANGTFGDKIAKLPARAAMTTIVAGLSDTKTVEEAARYFLRFRINSAPVVDAEGKLVGILSERDLISTTAADDWWSTSIKRVMKRNVVCYDEETPVAVINDFLARVSIRSVVIVKDGKPTGMMSRSSLLRWYLNQLTAGQAIPGHAPAGNGYDRVSEFSNSSTPSRDQLAMMSSALVKEVQVMEKQLHSAEDDLLASVVGGASRIQEMVNDLLAYSRFIHSSDDGFHHHDEALPVDMPADAIAVTMPPLTNGATAIRAD